MSGDLSTVKYSSIKNRDNKSSRCNICMLKYKEKHKILVINNCNHYFHKTCLKNWIKRSDTCPLCRCIIDSDNEDSEKIVKELIGLFFNSDNIVFFSVILIFIYYVLNK